MIHLYCGDGKGKTTCAMGLALRAAGRGQRVVIAQFLKGADSGERTALTAVPGVTLLPVPEQVPFTFAMDQQQRRQEQARSASLLARCRGLAEEKACDLLVMDELCGAVSTGMLPLEEVLALLDLCAGEPEVVLTGRDPDGALLERADYVTEMKKIRHPYDRGASARLGIEW